MSRLILSILALACVLYTGFGIPGLAVADESALQQAKGEAHSSQQAARERGGEAQKERSNDGFDRSNH
jgi:hypothetical protein